MAERRHIHTARSFPLNSFAFCYDYTVLLFVRKLSWSLNTAWITDELLPKSAALCLSNVDAIGRRCCASYSMLPSCRGIWWSGWANRWFVIERGCLVIDHWVMFLTGAFGLWDSFHSENRGRRIGQFVASGLSVRWLAAVGRAGQIIGYNPALVNLLPKHSESKTKTLARCL